jgi:threonine dehydrogenase-like Zn-dependent dehydrogenase
VLQAIDRARIAIGYPVIVISAGPIGLMAAHLARLQGASAVTVVEANEAGVDRARTLGFACRVPADGDSELADYVFRMRREGSIHKGRHLIDLYEKKGVRANECSYHSTLQVDGRMRSRRTNDIGARGGAIGVAAFGALVSGVTADPRIQTWTCRASG